MLVRVPQRSGEGDALARDTGAAEDTATLSLQALAVPATSPNVTGQRVKVRQGTLGQEPAEDAAATGQAFGHLKPNTQSSTESK